MKKFLLSLFFFSSFFVGNAQIRIFEIYAGGGNAGAPYNSDYVVLYNAGATSVNLSGFTLQYAPPTSGAWTAIALTGSILPNKFYLIKLGNDGGSAGVALPTPDLTDGLNVNATAGKMAIVNNSTVLTGANPLPNGSVLDFVGYGNTASASESSPAPSPSNTRAIRRNATGNDTNNNSVDLSTGAPNPLNSASSALPITLISFKANITESQQTVLKWATASEKDNDYFEIERSKNALDFESIGKSKGKGTIDLRNDYTFTDESPLKGINYYRLKQVDFDGQYSYTRTESVIRDGDGTISLFPNPTANLLKINFEDTEQIENTTIYNLMGKVVKMMSGNQSKYEINDLPQGKYILEISLSDGRIIRNSFVKN